MNNKVNKVLILIIVVLIVVMSLLYVSVRKDLSDSQKELSIHKGLTQSTMNELEEAKKKLQDEIYKSEELGKELANANEIISSRDGEAYLIDCEVTEYEINMIAKTVLGEAGGSSKIQQSAVVWCILNRVDAGWGTIAQVVTAPNQFHGYNSGWVVRDDIKELVEDVVARWKLEKMCCGDVGRTLPPEYLYFRSDGTGLNNIFRTEWDGDYEVWNWDCWNPYS